MAASKFPTRFYAIVDANPVLKHRCNAKPSQTNLTIDYHHERSSISSQRCQGHGPCAVGPRYLPYSTSMRPPIAHCATARLPIKKPNDNFLMLPVCCSFFSLPQDLQLADMASPATKETNTTNAFDVLDAASSLRAPWFGVLLCKVMTTSTRHTL